MPALVFEIEDGSQIVAPLAELTTVGSADGNDVIADRPDIAPRHAEIFPADDGGWWVRDLGSGGITCVNGERITSRRLAPGDTVAFGSITARFTLVDGEAAVDPALADAAAHVEMLTQRLSYLAQQERTKLADLDRLQHEVSGLEARKADADKAALDFTGDMREKADQLEQARKELDGARTDLDKTLKSAEAAAAREAAVLKSAAELAQRNQEAAAALQKAQGEHAAATADVGRLSVELKNLQEQAAKFTAIEESARKAAETAEAKRREATEKAEAELRVAMEKAGAQQREAAQIRKSAEDAAAREAAALKSAAELSQQNTEAAAALQKARGELATTSADVARLSVELKNLQEQAAKFMAIGESARKAAEKAEERQQAAASGRSEAELALAQATARLETTRTEHAAIVENLGSLQVDVGTLAETKRSLTEQNQVLESSADELAQRIKGLQSMEAAAARAATEAESLHLDTTAKKDEAGRALGEVTTKLNATQQQLATAGAHHEKLTAEIAGAESHHATVRAESEKFAALAQEGRASVDALETARAELSALNSSLQSRSDEITRRISELDGTEESLLRAQSDRKQTESERAALLIATAELAAQHETTKSEVATLTAKLDDCRGYQAWYEIELPKLKEQLETAQKNLAEFEVSAQTCIALTAKIESLKSSAVTEQTALESLRARTEQAQYTLDGLNQRNAELKTATRNLEDVQSQLRDATAQKAKLDARIAELERLCVDARSGLDELERTEKTANGRIAQLRTLEADLQNSLKSLGDDQQRERTRFEELRALAHDAVKEGERQRQELGNNVAALHAEIARLESRLAHARTWNAEIDQLYEALGTMPDGSPEAREHWLEIQRRKKAIAEQLPTGIQVRAPGRTQVVPRGR